LRHRQCVIIGCPDVMIMAAELERELAQSKARMRDVEKHAQLVDIQSHEVDFVDE